MDLRICWKELFHEKVSIVKPDVAGDWLAPGKKVTTSICFPITLVGKMVPAWAEDRAMLGSNPSADPGAKTEAGCLLWYPVSFFFPFLNLGIGINAVNPRGLGAKPPQIVEVKRPLVFAITECTE